MPNTAIICLHLDFVFLLLKQKKYRTIEDLVASYLNEKNSAKSVSTENDTLQADKVVVVGNSSEVFIKACAGFKRQTHFPPPWFYC